MIYLIDTSVWVDYFNETQTFASKFLRKLLISKSAISINNYIYMEVLQGIGNDKIYHQVKRGLDSYSFYNLTKNQQSYADAALIYSSCRNNGITIRSAIDCLIVQCAIENDLVLLHNDKNFEKIATIYPLLNQQKI